MQQSSGRPRIAGVATTIAAIALVVSPAVALTVSVNGQTATLSPPPIERAGRIFVPLRGVFEKLGASVVYQAGIINATGNGHRISLKIGSSQATVDGVAQTVDQAPFIVGASTYVPLRFVSQALGAGVNYDGTNKIVALTAPVAGAARRTCGERDAALARPARFGAGSRCDGRLDEADGVGEFRTSGRSERPATHARRPRRHDGGDAVGNGLRLRAALAVAVDPPPARRDRQVTVGRVVFGVVRLHDGHGGAAQLARALGARGRDGRRSDLRRSGPHGTERPRARRRRCHRERRRRLRLRGRKLHGRYDCRCEPETSPRASTCKPSAAPPIGLTVTVDRSRKRRRARRRNCVCTPNKGRVAVRPNRCS